MIRITLGSNDVFVNKDNVSQISFGYACECSDCKRLGNVGRPITGAFNDAKAWIAEKFPGEDVDDSDFWNHIMGVTRYDQP